MTETLPSSERLASALDDAGLPVLAQRARTNEFHDFASPHLFPAMMLQRELSVYELVPIVRELATRVQRGEFDAPKGEVG